MFNKITVSSGLALNIYIFHYGFHVNHLKLYTYVSYEHDTVANHKMTENVIKIKVET